MLQLAYNKLALYYLHAQLRMQNYKGLKIQGLLFLNSRAHASFCSNSRSCNFTDNQINAIHKMFYVYLNIHKHSFILIS